MAYSFSENASTGGPHTNGKSPDDREDGVLSANEISQMDLSTKTELAGETKLAA